MDELLAAAAEAMNVPEVMVERSAAARAKAEGVSVEDVLRAWAGGGEVAAAAPMPVGSAPSTSPAESAAETPAPQAPPSSSAPLDDAGIIAIAAEKMGMPESMVRRSAAARAKAAGVPVDSILAEWAGVEAGAPAPVPDVVEAPPAPAPPPGPVSREMAPAETAVAATAPLEIEVLGEADEAPPEATEFFEAFESEEESLAAGALPRWLAALFVIIPAFAIGYALFLPNGPNCGDAGSLAVDPVTGLAVNCDGSEFGTGFVDFFAMGAEVYETTGCSACHGPAGGGLANFPAFTDGQLLATFPEDACADQVQWIGLGTAGWPEPTYGATGKPVGGSGAVMPGFASTLTAEEMAAVALYERAAFGGQDLAAGLVDCGLSAGEGSGAEALGE